MSRHWKPDIDSARWTRADDYAPPIAGGPRGKSGWPEGATAGLLLVAAGCLAVGALLYQAATPRYAIEQAEKAEGPRSRCIPSGDC